MEFTDLFVLFSGLDVQKYLPSIPYWRYGYSEF